jgi:chromosome segregation ATPase
MSETTITLIANAVITPVLVLVTLWVKSSISKQAKRDEREDGFIADIKERITDLEREIKEVRVELKNRDAEYLELYKAHTTLKAKYEVLQADHEDLKQKYEHTVAELAQLGTRTSPTTL